MELELGIAYAFAWELILELLELELGLEWEEEGGGSIEGSMMLVIEAIASPVGWGPEFRAARRSDADSVSVPVLNPGAW